MAVSEGTTDARAARGATLPPRAGTRPAEQSAQPGKPIGTLACRQCGGTEVTILSGKYGYYFKCRTCSGNTPIKLDCVAGHRERLRKEGTRFFRECPECRTSEVYFSNPG